MIAIFAALLGASATGLISHRLTRHREQQKEQREKVGLLKLVHSEVTNNLEYLKSMGTYVSDDKEKVGALRSDAWEQSRTKLAELVDEDQFEYLVSCYGALSVFKTNLEQLPSVEVTTTEEHQAQVKSVTRQHWLAFDVCQKETGRFRAWSKGMLVSKPIGEVNELESEDNEQKAL